MTPNGKLRSVTDLSGELDGFNLLFSSAATLVSDLKSSDMIDSLPVVGSSVIFFIDWDYLPGVSYWSKQF